MSADWSGGVLTTSSWHHLERVAELPDVDAMIRAGEDFGRWPVSFRFEDIVTTSGLAVPARGLIASYRNGPDRCLAPLGERYCFTPPDEWRGIMRAAESAGGRPTGAFSLRDGTRLLGTFEVGQSNGTKTFLNVMDTLDGSGQFTCGASVVRVVCANTVAAWIRTDGDAAVKIRHTASLESKINLLTAALPRAIAAGEKVRDAYHKAEALTFAKADDARAAFDRLFPDATPEQHALATRKDKAAEITAAKVAVTRATNARAEARRAAALPVNRVGSRGNLATLWNTATWLVDRTVDEHGRIEARPTRGGDMLDSMLFGTRGDRVTEIQTIVEVIMRDGSVRSMTVPQALAAGVDPALTGRAILDDLIANP